MASEGRQATASNATSVHSWVDSAQDGRLLVRYSVHQNLTSQYSTLHRRWHGAHQIPLASSPFSRPFSLNHSFCVQSGHITSQNSARTLYREHMRACVLNRDIFHSSHVTTGACNGNAQKPQRYPSPVESNI